MAIYNPISIYRKEDIILHHCAAEDLDFCLPTETLVKEDNCNSVKKLRKWDIDIETCLERIKLVEALH